MRLLGCWGMGQSPIANGLRGTRKAKPHPRGLHRMRCARGSLRANQAPRGTGRSVPRMPLRALRTCPLFTRICRFCTIMELLYDVYIV
jgi:hypothetical protein